MRYLFWGDCFFSIFVYNAIIQSYSKTKIGQDLVHNYMIEENTAWRLRATLPNRSSPRLQNTEQYLSDLGWLQREAKNVSITTLGIKVLEAL